MTKLPMTGIMKGLTLGHPRSNRQENVADSMREEARSRKRMPAGRTGTMSVVSAQRIGSLLFGIIAFGIVATSASAAHAQKSPLAAAAYGRAQGHLVGSRFADAASEMEVAVRFEPRFALGWYGLASASRRAGQCDRAVAAYRRYGELRPAEADPHFGIGLCLQQVGDREGAITAFRRYVAADTRAASRPFVEVARKNLAALEADRPAAAPTPSPALAEARKLRDQGRGEDALGRLQAAIAANPKSVEAHTELGHGLVAGRRTRDAIAPLQTAVKLAPATATAWYDLAFALREDGQTAAAVDAYRRYITLRPEDPDAHYGLGRTLTLLGRNDEALTAFRTYTAMEKRTTERRWVRKAEEEIARLEGARRPAAGPAAATPGKPSVTPTPASTAPPPVHAAPPAAPDRALPLPPASLAPVAPPPAPSHAPPAQH